MLFGNKKETELKQDLEKFVADNNKAEERSLKISSVDFALKIGQYNDADKLIKESKKIYDYLVK